MPPTASVVIATIFAAVVSDWNGHGVRRLFLGRASGRLLFALRSTAVTNAGSISSIQPGRWSEAGLTRRLQPTATSACG
jgi:hypothetical protein